MFLYLVQHAEAKREEEDPQRPLSEKGIKDLKIQVTHIHSYCQKLKFFNNLLGGFLLTHEV